MHSKAIFTVIAIAFVFFTTCKQQRGNPNCIASLPQGAGGGGASQFSSISYTEDLTGLLHIATYNISAMKEPNYRQEAINQKYAVTAQFRVQQEQVGTQTKTVFSVQTDAASVNLDYSTAFAAEIVVNGQPVLFPLTHPLTEAIHAIATSDSLSDFYKKLTPEELAQIPDHSHSQNRVANIFTQQNSDKICGNIQDGEECKHALSSITHRFNFEPNNALSSALFSDLGRIMYDPTIHDPGLGELISISTALDEKAAASATEVGLTEILSKVKSARKRAFHIDRIYNWSRLMRSISDVRCQESELANLCTERDTTLNELFNSLTTLQAHDCSPINLKSIRDQITTFLNENNPSDPSNLPTLEFPFHICNEDGQPGEVIDKIIVEYEEFSDPHSALSKYVTGYARTFIKHYEPIYEQLMTNIAETAAQDPSAITIQMPVYFSGAPEAAPIAEAQGLDEDAAVADAAVADASTESTAEAITETTPTFNGYNSYLYESYVHPKVITFKDAAGNQATFTSSEYLTALKVESDLVANRLGIYAAIKPEIGRNFNLHSQRGSYLNFKGIYLHGIPTLAPEGNGNINTIPSYKQDGETDDYELPPGVTEDQLASNNRDQTGDAATNEGDDTNNQTDGITGDTDGNGDDAVNQGPIVDSQRPGDSMQQQSPYQPASAQPEQNPQTQEGLTKNTSGSIECE